MDCAVCHFANSAVCGWTPLEGFVMKIVLLHCTLTKGSNYKAYCL